MIKEALAMIFEEALWGLEAYDSIEAWGHLEAIRDILDELQVENTTIPPFITAWN